MELAIFTIIIFFLLFGITLLGINLSKQVGRRLQVEKALAELVASSKEKIFFLDNLQQKFEQLQQELLKTKTELARTQSTLLAEEKLMREQKNFLNTTKEQIELIFKEQATNILESKGRQLNQDQQQKLQEILLPLKEQLQDFSKQVSGVYDKEARERISLLHEIKHLKDLNQKIGEDAIQLTKALKGQVKTQGCWGELLLERALELAGLQKGKEYSLQVALKNNKGMTLIPDAVIYLPEGRNIIVDAKVTLTAYSRYVCALDEGNEEATQLHLKEHLHSLRLHLQRLNEKDYQDLIKGNALDFILLFMPIEGAFALAMSLDSVIYEEALAKNIVIVTPTTLLATLRTIENVWRVEKQNKNVQKIAQKAGSLYDKFASLCQTMTQLGQRLDGVQKFYDLSMGQLVNGKGNLVSKVEEMKAIGVKTNKAMPKSILAESLHNDSTTEENDCDDIYLD